MLFELICIILMSLKIQYSQWVLCLLKAGKRKYLVHLRNVFRQHLVMSQGTTFPTILHVRLADLSLHCPSEELLDHWPRSESPAQSLIRRAV